MDEITKNLETLIQKVMNQKNQKLDNAAVEAFCTMVTKESEGVHIASKLLASWIHSTIEWQALQSLTLLDICMKRCGPLFNSEIGKFRFLNEMIKLVSPKYLGNSTPISIREKVLNLLESWISNYPCEIKIKEAYEMLKKQGVIKSISNSVDNYLEKISQPTKVKNPIFDDEEKSKLLQKLLRSKNPNDLHAANKLIKNMVKDDEKRVQQDTRRVMELESIHNNVKLLSDMLDCYVPIKTDIEDIELMKELYEACEGLQPIIERLAQETQHNEHMLVEIVEASKDLENVRDKYTKVLLFNQSHQTLLDLTIPNLSSHCESNSCNTEKEINLTSSSQSDFELLKDIFGTLNSTTESFCLPDQSASLSKISDIPIMQPINSTNANKTDSKENVFDHLNELGEFFFKKNSSDLKIKGHFDKTSKDTSKVSLNTLIRQSEIQSVPETNFITNFTSDQAKQISFNSCQKFSNGENTLGTIDVISSCKEKFKKINQIENEKQKIDSARLMVLENKFEIKSLANIEINLETITPGNISPITVIDNRNGITVILHFAKDSPRPDVSVIVITTINKNCKPLTDYLFQAVVPKIFQWT